MWVGDLVMHVEVSGSSQEQGCVGGGPGMHVDVSGSSQEQGCVGGGPEDACGCEWQ